MRTLVEASPPASLGRHPRTQLGRWVHVRNLQDTWRMEHGTQHSPVMASTTPSLLQKGTQHTALTHTGMQCVRLDGAGAATGPGSQPAPPGSPERLQLTVSKVYSWLWLATAYHFFFFLMQFNYKLFLKKLYTCKHIHTAHTHTNPGIGLQLVATGVMKNGGRRQRITSSLR